MKRAVSVLDDLSRSAKQYAKRTRKSRSQIYAEALSEYLARRAPDEVTEDMDSVVEQGKGDGAAEGLGRGGRRQHASNRPEGVIRSQVQACGTGDRRPEIPRQYFGWRGSISSRPMGASPMSSNTLVASESQREPARLVT
jgi:hypothetical protein